MRKGNMEPMFLRLFTVLMTAALASGSPDGSTETVQWDETVAALVDSVSETSFIANIQTLEDLGTRHSSLPQYTQACSILVSELESWGYTPYLQSFNYASGGDSIECWNVTAEKEGAVNPDSVYIICSHLDSTSGGSIYDAPGADDPTVA